MKSREIENINKIIKLKKDAILKNHYLTVPAIAKKIGMSPSHLYNILNGNRKPKNETLLKIKNLLSSELYKISKN